MDDFKKINYFFKYDLEIKKMMVNMSPKEEYSSVEYSDILYKSLKDIEYYFNKIISFYHVFQIESNFVNNLFGAFYSFLDKNASNKKRLELFYKSSISELSEDVINLVGENCVGYLLVKGVSLSKCSTVNELLHVMHQTIINDERIFDSMPKISNKTNDFDYPIYLCGQDNELGQEIFNNIPLNLDIGYTHILSLNENKVLLMVRDRGHALTIDISRDNDKFYVNYFIPKICNINMVNSIKGVRKVNSDSNFTTGVFETDKNNIADSIVNLIESVPMDSDIEYDYDNFISNIGRSR